MEYKDNSVIIFLRNLVKNDEKHELVDSLYGDIIFDNEGPKVDFNSKGSIYGIFIQLKENQEINDFLKVLAKFIKEKIPKIKDVDLGQYFGHKKVKFLSNLSCKLLTFFWC